MLNSLNFILIIVAIMLIAILYNIFAFILGISVVLLIAAVIAVVIKWVIEIFTKNKKLIWKTKRK